jgi:hypothetical protein
MGGGGDILAATTHGPSGGTGARDSSRVIAIVVAAASTAFSIAPALAGPFKEGYYADSAAHTFLYPDMQYSASNRDWAVWVDESRANDVDPTDVETFRVTYHYKSGLTYPYVDVSWWTTDMEDAPGAAWCDKVYSGSKCDHWHVTFDRLITTDLTQEFIACQEIAHTLGLGHNNDSDSTKEHRSCTANDEDAYQAHGGTGDQHHLTGHDRWHLNQGY